MLKRLVRTLRSWLLLARSLANWKLRSRLSAARPSSGFWGDIPLPFPNCLPQLPSHPMQQRCCFERITYSSCRLPFRCCPDVGLRLLLSASIILVLSPGQRITDLLLIVSPRILEVFGIPAPIWPFQRGLRVAEERWCGYRSVKLCFRKSLYRNISLDQCGQLTLGQKPIYLAEQGRIRDCDLCNHDFA